MSAEIKVYGRSAVRSLWELRPQDIIRVYVTEERRKEFGTLLRWCAQQKKAYHIVTSEELDRISEGTHHEGVCALRRYSSVKSLAQVESPSKSSACLYIVLENPGNPHNIGAVLRSAAHFGAAGVVVLQKEPLKPSASMIRTAAGGFEIVPLLQATSLVELEKFAKNAQLTIVATSSHQQKIKEIRLKDLPKRLMLLCGTEGEGLSKGAVLTADSVVSIAGTGQMESLNLAAAAAVLMNSWFAGRQG